jgi:hypothetical protein
MKYKDRLKSPYPHEHRVYAKSHAKNWEAHGTIRSVVASDAYYRRGVVALPPLTRVNLTAAQKLPHAIALCREHTMPFCTKCGILGTESYEEAVARKLKESGICRLDDGTIVRQENPTVAPRKMSFAERLVKNG